VGIRARAARAADLFREAAARVHSEPERRALIDRAGALS
jgi:hypothetical protein